MLFTLNRFGDSEMIFVFDIWLVEGGYLSFIYAQEAFSQPQKIIKGQLRPKRLMMVIKGQKFEIVSFHEFFCLIDAQKAFSQSEKILEGPKAGHGHQRPQSKNMKKSHFINRYCLCCAQEAFPQPEKNCKGQKADEGHQRPQSKYAKCLSLCSGRMVLPQGTTSLGHRVSFMEMERKYLIKTKMIDFELLKIK